MKILFVDDESANLEISLDYFKMFDYEDVIGIQTPQEAIAYIRENKPDIVFLDVSLGEDEPMTGVDVLREVSKTTPESKIVMVSAYSQYEPEARALGCYDYVVKPYLPKKLLEMVKSLELQRSKT